MKVVYLNSLSPNDGDEMVRKLILEFPNHKTRRFIARFGGAAVGLKSAARFAGR
jgi:hypothetical protein